jgi:polyhydroxyalkanoate synthesis regulator phasin
VTALTPDDLARIEELWRSTGIIDNDDMRALVTGVRSLQSERDAFLESARLREVFEDRTIAAETQVRSLQARITELERERDQNHAAYLTAIGANIR